LEENQADVHRTQFTLNVVELPTVISALGARLFIVTLLVGLSQGFEPSRLTYSSSNSAEPFSLGAITRKEQYIKNTKQNYQKSYMLPLGEWGPVRQMTANFTLSGIPLSVVNCVNFGFHG
jgi:hypothetical protein